MIRAAPANGCGVSKRRPIAAVALDHGTLGTPPVDPAELHFLNLITPSVALHNGSHLTYPLPHRKYAISSINVPFVIIHRTCYSAR